MIQASQRAIARGERPSYRVRLAAGAWEVEGAPWLSGPASSRSAALAAARTALATMLEVDPGAFEVVAD